MRREFTWYLCQRSCQQAAANEHWTITWTQSSNCCGQRSRCWLCGGRILQGARTTLHGSCSIQVSTKKVLFRSGSGSFQTQAHWNCPKLLAWKENIWIISLRATWDDLGFAHTSWSDHTCWGLGKKIMCHHISSAESKEAKWSSCQILEVVINKLINSHYWVRGHSCL